MPGWHQEPEAWPKPGAVPGCISGALSERVFRAKLANSGFVDAWVGDPVPFGLGQAALYPLFTPELIEQMRAQLPAYRHDHVATSVRVTATRPAG